jgi:hypothetical protein
VTPPIPYKTVSGAYVGPDGAPVAGAALRFIPSATVVDTDGAGAFSVQLAVTDDPDTQPVGWTWRLSELFPGGREVDFFVPSALPGAVDFADLSPATDVDVRYAYATTATWATLEGRVTSLEATAAIVNAGAVLIHPFLLMD